MIFNFKHPGLVTTTKLASTKRNVTPPNMHLTSAKQIVTLTNMHVAAAKKIVTVT